MFNPHKRSQNPKINRKRQFLFIFSHTNGWWGDYLPGYTHVTLMEILPNNLCVGFDPLLSQCKVMVRPPLKQATLTEKDYAKFRIVEVTIDNVSANRLIKPMLQTCATIVQYLAGISLRCVTAQGLYTSLTAKEPLWLATKGIVEVKVWESPKHKAHLHSEAGQ